MKKKTIIAFFCTTFSVCANYGGLRYTVSSSTGQVTMADTLQEENRMGDIVSPCSSKDHLSSIHISPLSRKLLGFYDYSNTSRPIFLIFLTSSSLSIAPSANACCNPGPNEIAVGPFPLYIAASSFGFQPERHHNLLLLW